MIILIDIMKRKKSLVKGFSVEKMGFDVLELVEISKDFIEYMR